MVTQPQSVESPNLTDVVPVNICGVPVSTQISRRLQLGALSGQLSPFEQEIILSSGVQLDLQQLNLPSRIQFVTWPVDGSFAALPKGQTLIDVENASVINAAGTGNLIYDPEVLSQVRSLAVVADSPVTVQMEPNLGAFAVADGIPLIGNGKRLQKIILDTGDVPANVRVVFSASSQAPITGSFAQAQYRYIDQIFTKSAAAASQDGLTPATIRARFKDTISAIDDSANFFLAEHVGQKTFLIRNIGPGAIEVLLQGAMFKTVADIRGYIADTDSGPGRQTVASGDELILESGIPYSVMQLGIAVAQAEAAGQTARAIVEYKGMTDRTRS